MSGAATRLGVTPSRLRIGEEAKQEGTWAGRRLLWLDDEPAFELSFWCGTCAFLFRRLEGANQTVSVEQLQDRLAEGIGLEPDVIATFSGLLPEDDYLPMLLSVTPRLSLPMRAGDYFAEEQVATWGLSGFWGLPEYPQTPYYRTYETGAGDDGRLFEFVVPMVPHSWNDQDRVAEHARRLATSSTPTAVAVSTLDVTQPAMDAQSTDYYQHWGLTHFLLDGHHKLQAAAEAGLPMRLLSLVATGASLATSQQLSMLSALRAQPATQRKPRPPV